MPSILKSLELHGYKTFANRTLFEFAGNVTAIVGPNGSGKSNITDSLRWVLGEQSYRLLRGKKTEDMIFSGSEKRSRAGMASATITFDNSDGWLPIDFSEVAIARRAYRDGQNEYLINGQRMRLKDVSELLAQSGLAERTYTVIGQGLVDAALALKAEERRSLFEEAAGIGLHRSRRGEALRRLEITRRNLERVQDILAELRPRLRSLERQARRAQEYEHIKADLHILLREWYGYHWHRSQRELAEAYEIANFQENRLDQAHQNQAQYDEKLINLREHVRALRTSLNSWHGQLAQLHTQREALSRKLAVADERARSLYDRQNRMRDELANLNEEVGLHRDQLMDMDQEIKRLESELAEARSQAENARNALTSRQAERSAAERSLQDIRQDLSGLNARQGQLQAHLLERKAQIERSRKSLEASVRTTAMAEQEHQAKKSRLHAAQQIEREAEKVSVTAEEALQSHRQRIVDVEHKLKQVSDERTNAMAELARLKAKLEVLTQAEAGLVGYASGTRTLLQAARQDRLKGTRGALSNYLEVPEEFEIAVAAALGDYLDAVLLDGDSEDALDLLDKEDVRGVLLPLTNLKPAAPLSITDKGAAEVIGVAADLVQAPPDLRPAVDLLLGQVLVVQDRLLARLVLVNQMPGVRVVTLRGEVFHANGPVQTSGGGAQPKSQTTLSRARQQRELSDLHTHIEQRVAGLDERVGQLETIRKGLLEESGTLELACKEARQEWEKAALSTNQTRLDFEQAGRQIRWQREQHEHLENDIVRNQVDVDDLSAELMQVESDLSQARERMRGAESLLAMLPLDEFQTQVAHWYTLAAVSERTLDDAKARQREWHARLEKLEDSQTTLQNLLEELVFATESLEVDKENQRKSEAEIGKKIKALQALIDPAEVDLEAAEQEQVSLQKGEVTSRQKLSTAEHHHAQARIILARRQEALQTLRHRIEDDLGLVAFEYVEQVSGPTPLPLDGIVEQLPMVSHLSPDLEEMVRRQRAQLRRMGAINPDAQAEYLEVKQRFEFLTDQVGDLHRAEADVRQVISELDTLMEREFRKTFDAVAAEFRQIFSRLFGGGSARLLLTDPDDLTVSGIDIEARLPGRRTQGLSLLSGGERSLTATALVFALLKVSPTPFCVLDEVDAMLDEANVSRFRDLLRELSQNTQFVIVTHNRNTVQVADVIYGVTMGRDSVSQILSLKLDEVSNVVD